MSLQSRLVRGIAVILAIIGFFIALTWWSYHGIDGLIRVTLPRQVTAARTYERFADLWSISHQKAHDQLQIYEDASETESLALIEKLNNVSQKLDNLIDDEKHRENLKQINHLCASFTSQLNVFFRQMQNRNRIHRKKVVSRLNATKGLNEEVVNLLDRFKRMLGDFNTALKNPDFQASLGHTSQLLEKISRVEKDLFLAETEIALYISLNGNKAGPNTDPKSARKAAERVESRIRAILFLLENSAEQNTTVLQKRVLNNIKDKIKSFFESFQRLRNILEAPESDLIEIEDQLAKMASDLNSLTRTGTQLCSQEAEYFWTEIFAISDEMESHATGNYYVSLAFLLLVLAAGIRLLMTLPGQIAGPLKMLNLQIENFKLGSEICPLPSTNTEEIDNLARSFLQMGHKLKEQASINQNYLESIHYLNRVYRELHQTQQRIDLPNERREKAINTILDQLFMQCPKIDMLKVMERTQDGKAFKQLGRMFFSETFPRSPEYPEYCESVDLNPDDYSSEKLLPENDSLTGYFFEGEGLRLAADENRFFLAEYPMPQLRDLPTLANRATEKGLQGSILTEPLVIPQDDPDEDSRKLGLLFIYIIEPNTRLSWQDMYFIQIIASQLASVIEIDHLLQNRDEKKILDEQMNMAKEIQENLLPATEPKIPNLNICKLWKSAAEVGGDFYDFFILGKNRIGIVIADASGKNIPAAIIMTVFKTALSTMELDKIPAGEVLTRANKVIAKNITADRFITAMYVIIDSETGEVQLSSAGHNPAVVVSGRGHETALHEKNVNCMPLGIIDSFEYESISFRLKKNDLLLLYTDGVTEARNADGEEFGQSGLSRYLRKPRSSKPARDLEQELIEFSMNAGQHDDITAVFVEFKGSESDGKSN